MISTSPRWYLACHKTGKQNLFLAQAALANLDVNTFSPMIRSMKERADCSGKRLTTDMLFPGYFFLEFAVEETPLEKIKHCRGFNNFVQFGNDIKPVPDSLIEEMMNLPMCLIERDVKKHTQSSPKLSPKNKQILTQIIEQKDKLARTSMMIAFMESI